jgi:anti-anti-sigma factor
VTLGSGEGTAGVAPGIRVVRADSVVVLSLAGEHDLASRDEVQGALTRALDGRLAVVVDLREADFVDSVVAALFLDARKTAKREDLGFGIVLSPEPDNGVRRMFELSTLTAIFAIYPTPEAAVAGVRGGFVEPATRP